MLFSSSRQRKNPLKLIVDKIAFLLILLFYLFLYINSHYLVVYTFSFSVGYRSDFCIPMPVSRQTRNGRLLAHYSFPSLITTTETAPKTRNTPAMTNIITCCPPHRYLSNTPPSNAATICGKQIVQLNKPK